MICFIDFIASQYLGERKKARETEVSPIANGVTFV